MEEFYKLMRIRRTKGMCGGGGCVYLHGIEFKLLPVIIQV